MQGTQKAHSRQREACGIISPEELGEVQCMKMKEGPPRGPLARQRRASEALVNGVNGSGLHSKDKEKLFWF